MKSFCPEIKFMTHDKAIWVEFKFVKDIFQIRIMFYYLNHLLLVMRGFGEPGSRSLFDYGVIFEFVGNCPHFDGK